MSNLRTRREFGRDAALGGLAAWLATGTRARGFQTPGERINFACIGVGGKGDSDTADAARFGNIVAICDVDDNTLNSAAGKYPKAKKYHDYRKMLDEVAGEIDAVTVSTPDHTHAVAAAAAMQLKKHVFCQKPMTHSIWEARQLGELAREHKLATQMGNQGTADGGLRRSAAMVMSGVLGAVTEVHVWSNRPSWAQGVPRPAEKPVPANLDWDLWIGPAKPRPYGDGYHAFSWRGWWDFGTGALGDMACHTMNLPFMALDLRDPVALQAKTSGHNKDSYPKWSIIDYEFAATDARPALKLTWYDGTKKPPAELLPGIELDGSGSLFIGEKGKLYSPGDSGGNGRLIGVEPIEVDYPESPGHFEEFARAIKEGTPAMSSFPNYASPLTETVLLGNLAVWADGKRIEWDAKKLAATNAPELAEIIRPQYHNGYSL